MPRFPKARRGRVTMSDVWEAIEDRAMKRPDRAVYPHACAQKNAARTTSIVVILTIIHKQYTFDQVMQYLTEE